MQKWIPFGFKCLKLFLVLGALGIAFLALDASAEEQVFDEILTKYQNAAAHWQGIMLSAAKAIFWPLALISLSWRLIQKAVDGVDMAGLFREIFWPGFFIGFYYFLLVNGANIASAILATFMHLADRGSAVSGMASLAFSPSGIMSMANEIWWEVLKTSGKGLFMSIIPGTDAGLFANLFGIFVSFGIWVLMAMVAIDVLILLIASWVLLYGGLVILAFGGGFGFGFHQYALNYFRSVIALGLQLLGTGLIVTVGLSVMQTDLLSIKDGFNLQTLMSFLLCAMAMKMVVSSIPPMLAGMINGNVGSLGPKGEGVIGGLVGGGVTAATTTVSLGLGAAAGAKVKAAQAGLDQVKAAVNARNVASGGSAPVMPNTISAATSTDGESSEGSSYSKAMGLNPGGSTYGGSDAASPQEVPQTNELQTSLPAQNNSMTEETAGSQAAPSEPSVGAVPVIPDLSSSYATEKGSGAKETEASKTKNGQNVDNDFSPDAGTNQNISATGAPLDTGNLSNYSMPQLEAMQKAFEDQIRKYSAKRDYHFASARSAFASGSKTLFNYMAFFNNRGYF